MKTFKQFCFILENNRAPLYHGTGDESAHHVLKSGSISSSGAKNGQHRISTSRDKKYAHEWGELGHDNNSVTFHLDHNKIKHNQKVKPADYHGGSDLPQSGDDMDMRHDDYRRSESEENIKGKVSTKHITHMSLNKKMDSKVKSKLIKAAAKHAPHIKITSH